MFTPEILMLLIGAAVAGGFVVGLAGFGGGPVVLGIWLLFLEPMVEKSIGCSFQERYQK